MLQFEDGNDKNCYCCGKKGHLSPDCPEKDTRKKSDWHMHKAVSAYQDAGGNDKSKKNEGTTTSQPEKKDGGNSCEDKKVKWTKSAQGFLMELISSGTAHWTLDQDSLPWQMRSWLTM